MKEGRDNKMRKKKDKNEKKKRNKSLGSILFYCIDRVYHIYIALYICYSKRCGQEVTKSVKQENEENKAEIIKEPVITDNK